MEQIKKHLTDSEKVLWSKKADYKLLDNCDILSIPLTLIVFGGISVIFSFYLYVHFMQNPGTAFYFLTAGLLIYVLSFYFILGRFFYRKKRRSKEQYYITNKRIILLTDLVYSEIEYVLVKDAHITQVKNDLIFGNQNLASDLFYNLGLDALLKMRPKRTIKFCGIKNPDEALNIIDKIKKEGHIS